MKLITTKVVLLLCLATTVRSARILAVFPTPSFSHQIVYQPIWRELSLRGHQMTVMTTDPLNDPTLTNLTEINWSSSYGPWKKIMALLNKPLGMFDLMYEFDTGMVTVTEEQLSHPEVKRILQNENEHFDLVIVEWILSGMSSFSFRFKCPMVGLSSMATMLHGFDAVGNPTHPIYAQEFSAPFHGKLNLLEKIVNTLFSIWMRYYTYYLFQPMMHNVYKKHFGDDLPPLSETERKVSLLLFNVNPIFYPAKPNVPAIKELGGIGIHMKSKKPLPEDLQTYLDNSKQGVIYFSLGSNIQTAVLTPSKLDAIISALSEIPYNVLCKWENNSLEGKPDNIKISRWLPQQDILGHPNIRLFITQGGLQSLEEALYNKIPCLGMPFTAEQKHNLVGAEKHGFAKIFEYKSLTKESFKEAILEIINNSEYEKNAQKALDIVNDEPMKPVETAIWWIEYVLRHKGADHLRCATVDMPWYQYLLLDVIGVVVSMLALVFLIVYLLIKVSVNCIKKYICYFKCCLKREKLKKK